MSRLQDLLTNLSRDELIDLCENYDSYVWQIINENEGEPVCLSEYIENDWQSLRKESYE